MRSADDFADTARDMRLIDTHAHLDEINNLDSAISQAKAAGLLAIIAVGSGYESNRKILEISQRYPGFVFPALGLHPSGLGYLNPAGIEKVLRHIEENIGQAVAIGEVGLDYHKRVLATATKDYQQAVFQDLASLAVKYQKPLSIHSRYSWRDALELVAGAGVKQAVFHWYTGPLKILDEIIADGYSVSATPALEYHAEHRTAIKEVPLTNLLLETDSPVEYGREHRFTSRPGDVCRVLNALTELKANAEPVIAEQTTQNALNLFL